MGRKKRLEKGIESLKKQIDRHKKKVKSYKGPKSTLIEYWNKEIDNMEQRKEEQERKVKKLRK